ncbi:MAG: GTP 3',8-cyclase MoaA [Candidatus Omnitrophota bacterium]|jgi:cyclic pyranopterin phosphate synthase
MNDQKPVDYLRLSLTDQCNLSCGYCKNPAGQEYASEEDVLNFSEIEFFVKTCADLGVRTVRLTGGEPLLRPDLPNLVRILKKIDGIEEICLTTNGVLLAKLLDPLLKAGLSRVNVSLDTLRPDRFHAVAGYACFSDVMDGIERLKQSGLRDCKLNMVLLNHVNDDEIFDFLKFSRSCRLILRFIEFMRGTIAWTENYFIPVNTIQQRLRQRSPLTYSGYSSRGPATYYDYDGQPVGFIRTTQQNCCRCTRLRLSSRGDLKVCLFQKQGVPLKPFLKRRDYTGLRAALRVLIRSKDHVDHTSWEPGNVSMSSIGG